MITRMKYAVVKGWEKCPAQYAHRSVSDVAVDSSDRIYLFTRNDNRVLVFERDGTFVTAWGEGRFRGRAHGITAGPDDGVYCVNDLDHTVRKFTPGGELLLTLGTAGVPSDTGYDRTRKTQYEKNASIVRGGPPFHRPTRIAIAKNGEMYVADGYGNCRVHRFSADGKLLQSWGAPGTRPGQFLVPHGIAVAADGRVLVADRENDRIQVFTPDGEYLTEWKGLSRPTSLFIDRAQLVYVTETGWAFDPEGPLDNSLPIRVSVFDAQGSLLARWENVEGSDLGAFAAPHGICVDSQGSIYLASNNRRDRADSAADADNAVDYSLQKFSRVM